MENYLKNKDNWSKILRNCRTKFGRRVLGICKFIAKVRESRFIVDAPRRENACAVRSHENYNKQLQLQITIKLNKH